MFFAQLVLNHRHFLNCWSYANLNSEENLWRVKFCWEKCFCYTWFKRGWKNRIAHRTQEHRLVRTHTYPENTLICFLQKQKAQSFLADPNFDGDLGGKKPSLKSTNFVESDNKHYMHFKCLLLNTSCKVKNRNIPLLREQNISPPRPFFHQIFNSCF